MTYILQMTGSTEWTDRETVFRVLDQELECFFVFIDSAAPERKKDFVLRHGVARGADTLANEWARERGVTVERFPAQWKDPVTGQYNPSAGPIRNREMAHALPRADRCVAFWSGKLRRNRSGQMISGTLDMISVMLAIGVEVRVAPPRDPT